MIRLVCLVLLAVFATGVVLAAPRAASTTSPPICPGYMWGVTIEPLANTPAPVYNQYVVTTACGGPAWVQSSSISTPPTSITPWGRKYECQVPEVDQYFCGEIPVATCCGNSTSTTLA